MIYTVFFINSNRSPVDFPTYKEAKEFAEEIKEEEGNDVDYTIQETPGEVV